MSSHGSWGRRIPRLFLDVNIPIYAGGQPHPLQQPCRSILLLASDHLEGFVTDAEVLQEILHRYLALRRWPAGRAIFDPFYRLMRGRIAGIDGDDLQAAATLADRFPLVQARDLLHAAVMGRLGISAIVSADRGFDALPDITRFDPSNPQDVRDYVFAEGL